MLIAARCGFRENLISLWLVATLLQPSVPAYWVKTLQISLGGYQLRGSGTHINN